MKTVKHRTKLDLTKKQYKLLLNDFFVLDNQETNEATIQGYANENKISLQ